MVPHIRNKHRAELPLTLDQWYMQPREILPLIEKHVQQQKNTTESCEQHSKSLASATTTNEEGDNEKKIMSKMDRKREEVAKTVAPRLTKKRVRSTGKTANDPQMTEQIVKKKKKNSDGTIGNASQELDSETVTKTTKRTDAESKVLSLDDLHGHSSRKESKSSVAQNEMANKDMWREVIRTHKFQMPDFRIGSSEETPVNRRRLRDFHIALAQSLSDKDEVVKVLRRVQIRCLICNHIAKTQEQL